MAIIDYVNSKSGLIGYLEGSIKGAISGIKMYDDLTPREQMTLKFLEEVLKNSQDTWEKVQGTGY
jgi:hypothetical protein